MSDVSDPLLTCDTDVVGSDANLNYNTMLIDDADVVGSDVALNNNTMHIDDADVVGSDAALNDNTIHVDMDVDVTAENTHSCHCSLSPQLPASVLSSFLSISTLPSPT